jgi:type 1 fimbria pilin
MNKRLSLLTAALLLTGASSAFAASSTDLTVTGFITPAACTPGLSNGGVVDYAKIPVKDLNQDDTTSLGRITLQLRVDCDEATTYALNVKDNRPNTDYHRDRFGLGLINTSQRLGGYQIAFSDAITESGPKTVIGSLNQGETWFNNEGAASSPTQYTGFGDRTTGRWFPAAIKNLAANMTVNTSIAPARGLTLTSEVELDGSSTLEVKYL